MLSQILKIIRLLGLRRAARMKKHHEQGLTYVRGYTATCCWWTLLNQGFLDHLAETGSLDWRQYAQEQQWDERNHVSKSRIELDSRVLISGTEHEETEEVDRHKQSFSPRQDQPFLPAVERRNQRQHQQWTVRVHPVRRTE